ncbi:MAG: hypothetical protein CMK85_10625 [Pseudomonadales bacterium]|nr:hypothetical protein [Pseudomonadales bacterium]MAK74780.1 hypothetical protein [Pseudomonadales bacterium]MAP76795.1 hypothetical protein [Pseudomonadales bacterium]MBP76834.1 hypothetical protein [Pseudomonadales bacterium]
MLPQTLSSGKNPAQTAGRSGEPKIAQRISDSSCTQGTPAGLPPGMPGIGEVMDGAVQQAPHSARQSINHPSADGRSDWMYPSARRPSPGHQHRTGQPAP